MTFNQTVWETLSLIPKGKVITYGEIARVLKKPKASRAVGNACNANPHAPAVPCHRVVTANGSIGGYAFGEKKKIALLKKEGIRVNKGKIVDFEQRKIMAEAVWQFQKQNTSG